MVHHVDGEPIEDLELPSDATPRRALGWLAAGREIPQGDCPPGVVRVLEEAVRHPVARRRGYFQCPLCPLTGTGPTTYVSSAGEEMHLGDASVEITLGDVVWRAPSLVLHYVRAHRYLPPATFLSGLLPTYWLSSLDSALLEPVRRCVVERVIAFDTGKEALLARIDPPVVGQHWDLGADVATVVLASRHEGQSLDPVEAFPCFVHVATSRHGWDDLETPVRADDLITLAWGELYRTADDAAAHRFEGPRR